MHDESEYTTDLQKCIEEIDSRSTATEAATIIILGGLSGRLDQTTHVLALLQKLRRGGKRWNERDEEASTSAWQGSEFKVFMGDELVSNSRGEDLYKDFGKGDGTKDIRVISENCVAWVLDVVSLRNSDELDEIRLAECISTCPGRAHHRSRPRKIRTDMWSFALRHRVQPCRNERVEMGLW